MLILLRFMHSDLGLRPTLFDILCMYDPFAFSDCGSLTFAVVRNTNNVIIILYYSLIAIVLYIHAEHKPSIRFHWLAQYACKCSV